MRVTCVYYDNPKILTLVLKNLFSKCPLLVLPIAGTYHVNESGFQCLGEDIELLVGSGNKFLFTNNTLYKAFNKKIIEYTPSNVESMYSQISKLLLAKYENSKNAFIFECNGEGVTVSLSIEEGESVYTLKTPSGNIIVDGSEKSKDLFNKCESMKLFSSFVITEDSDREVTVRRGQIEILRQISSYLNKMLVVYLHGQSGVEKEYYVLPAGCYEPAVNRTGGFRLMRINKTSLPTGKLSVCAVDCTLDEIKTAASASNAIRRLLYD